MSLASSLARPSSVISQDTDNREVKLEFHSSVNYYATDILDEFIAFLEENNFSNALSYLMDEFNIDGVYDVFAEDNDDWVAVINWLRREAAIFQGYELDFEIGTDHDGSRVYIISGEV